MNFFPAYNLSALLSPRVLRLGFYGVGLLTSFGLGAWTQSSASRPQTAVKPASSVNGSNATVPAQQRLAPPSAWVKSVPVRAAEIGVYRAAPLGGSLGRLVAMIQQVAAMDQKQALDALHKVDLQGGAESRQARQLLVARFAELDPETALSYTDTLSGEERGVQKITAFKAWAGRNPTAAASYLEDQLMTGGLASDDDAQAVAAVASAWSQTDPEAAWQWVAELPPDARAEAVRSLALNLADAEPGRVLSTLQSLPDSYDRAVALEPLVSRWAERDPEKTADWVASLGDPQEKKSAASGLVSAWMVRDPMAASRWVMALPSGGARDAAISSMIASQSIRNDPEAATRWAVTVQEPLLRQQLVAQSLNRWRVHDADAAQRWALAH